MAAKHNIITPILVGNQEKILQAAEELAGARFIAEAVRSHPGEVAIAVIGAATDLALALRSDAACICAVRLVFSLILLLPRLHPLRAAGGACRKTT